MFKDKPCEYCNTMVPAFEICKCHVNLELRGHPQSVKAMLDRLERLFEIIKVIEAPGYSRTPEVNVLVIIKNSPDSSDIPNAFIEADWD